MAENAGDHLRAAARRLPDNSALLAGDAVVTYGELDADVDAAAARLADLGLAPGDRLALLLGNTPAFAVALYAVWRAGLVAVPVNPGSTVPELIHILATRGPGNYLRRAARAGRRASRRSGAVAVPRPAGRARRVVDGPS